jgi:uncharacterized RDD family membrane protein YckC
MKGKIACIVHANREATTSCGVCGHRLCAACAVNVNGIDYCETCAPASVVRHEFDQDYEQIPVLDAANASAATFSQRLMAFLIDLMLFVLIAFVVGIISWALTGKFFVASPSAGPAFFILWGVLLVAGIIYATIMTSMTGQTFGKQVVGIIVLQPDGQILDWRTAALREIAAVLSAAVFGLGFLWMIWDKNHETWHDKISHTRAFQWEEVT